MDIDELQTVQSKERQKDSLQHLRDSFYEDVAAYIAELKAEREQVAEAADEPFSDPEVSRLSDDIERAEDVVEAVYERRVGKVVKMASFAAADMPVEEEGLTTQERDLFEDMVGRIGENRSRVLDILAGEGDSMPASSAGAPGAQPEPAEPAEPPERTSPESEPEPEPSTTNSPDHSEPAVGTGAPASTTDESSDTPDAPPDAPPDEPDMPPEAAGGGDGPPFGRRRRRAKLVCKPERFRVLVASLSSPVTAPSSPRSRRRPARARGRRLPTTPRIEPRSESPRTWAGCSASTTASTN